MKSAFNIHIIGITALMLLLLCSITNSLAQVSPNGVNTIMIDPGHGGKDPGAVYRHPTTKKLYTEKEINLNVSLLLGDMIKKNLPDVKVLYTRSTDVFIDLYKRGDMANKASADLFLSIHTNAVAKGTPSGAMTFVMGTDDNKNKQNLEIAMQENAVISYETNYESKYEGYDPNSAESFIIFSVMQYANQSQSVEFATTIQKHYKSSTALPDLSARQQNFLVLWKTAMPSVLTELGFITTPKDRNYLISSKGQKDMATALFNAFSEYKAKVEGNTTPIQLSTDASYAGTASTSNSSTVSGNYASSTTRETNTVSSSSSGIVYRVQIGSGRAKLGRNDKLLKPYNWNDITITKNGSIYRYYVGALSTHREATRLMQEVKRNVSDAFIVAFDSNNRQISVDDARRKTD